MRLRTAMSNALSLGPSSLSSSGFPFLSSALDNFKIGVALLDRRLRYRAVNGALAEFNDLPVEAHPGKSLHEVMPESIFKKAGPLIERVFSTGQPSPNLRRSGRLLTRAGPTLNWLSYYFPVGDSRRRVVEIGIMVMELKPSSALKGPFDPRSSPAIQQRLQKSGQISHSDGREHPDFANPRESGVILSSREQQVIGLLAEGKSNKEISAILAISVKTVETYRSRVMLKINAPSLIHLVHYAIRHRFVDLQA